MKDLIKKLENIKIYQLATSQFLELISESQDSVINFESLLDLVFNTHKYSIVMLDSLIETVSAEVNDETK